MSHGHVHGHGHSHSPQLTKTVRYPVAQQIIYAIYALDLTESHFRFEAL